MRETVVKVEKKLGGNLIHGDVEARVHPEHSQGSNGGGRAQRPDASEPLEFSPASSLRAKIVWAFVAIALVVGSSVVVTWTQLHSLIQDSRALHGETMPRLLAYVRLESELRSLLRATSQLTVAEDATELAASEKLVQESLNRVQNFAANSPELDPRLQALTDRIGAHAEEQAAGVQELLTLQERQAVLAESDYARLAQLRNNVLDEILLARSRQAESVDLEHVRDKVSALTSILLQVSGASSAEQLDQLLSRYRIELRSLVPALTRIDSEAAANWAEPLLELVDPGAGAPRLLDLKYRVLRVESDLGAASDRAAADIDDVESLVAEVRKASERESERSRVGTNNAYSTALWSLVIAVVVLLLTLGASFYFVEVRVLRRLRRMLAELTAISRGDFNRTVTPGGEREIADIAQVAEVLRANSSQLTQAMQEVEERSKTLSEFAYVASHDLKSPLRSVISLANFVIEDSSGILPAASRKHMDMVVERASRLEKMLEELLRYSRLGHTDYPFEILEVANSLEDVAALVGSAGNIDVFIEGGPIQIEVQRPPFELAFRNLFTNSIKHTDKDMASLSVTLALQDNETLQIDVIDDGPGLPSQYSEQVFGLFERLNLDANGTGMGLTLVRRAAESIGGSAVTIPRDGRGFHVRLCWKVRQLAH